MFLTVESQIIIGIPGLWKNRTELVQEFVSKSMGYILAGNIIHHIEKDIAFEIDVYDHDPSLREAFYMQVAVVLTRTYLAS